MKSILLASASVFAFAGAAAADGHTDLNVTGDAELGYNDDIDNGMYWGAGLGVSASTALDNGVTAGFSLDIDIDEDFETDGILSSESTLSQNLVSTSDFVLSLSTDSASLDFGDTDPSADRHWSGVTNMDNDGFAEVGDASEEGQLVGEYTFGDVTGSLSYAVVDTNGAPNDDDLTNMQFAAVADLGQFGVTVAYQDEDNPGGEIFGLSGSTTLSGADITASFVNNDSDAADTPETAFGVEGSMPFGPVTATLFYVSQQDDAAGTEVDDNYGFAIAYSEGPVAVDAFYHDGNDEDFGLHASYDVGNGLVVYAGGSDADGVYGAGEYDLGGGAALLVAYADDEDDATNDEIGPQEYKHGTTVEVSFEF
ncbi:porin [Roseovarius sp. SYSU LYC5161]|uniref:porin n=1 Tax=Roseovarius halophilus (ex Wu et al. 2025) TaxID=3376060 RepID=UPI00399BBC65